MDINSPLPPHENCWLDCKVEGSLGKCLGSVGSDSTEGWDLGRGSFSLGIRGSVTRRELPWGTPSSHETGLGGAEGHMEGGCILDLWPG